jgi:nucleolar pre-ribosomal-associated protein 1
VEGPAPFNLPSFTSSRQLQQLLHSSPHAPAEEIKSGKSVPKVARDAPLTILAIDQFTYFLSSISSDEATPTQPRSSQLKVLKDYCDEQSSTSHEQVDFPDLLSAWTNATQSNTEPVLSAVPTALTQFFRAISNHVEFREFGLSLCHSLLKRDQLRIFDRSLSSPRAKEHLITPCLQLLAQIASFDGGALASNVFNRRDLLYRRLDGILTQIPSDPTRHQDVSAHQAGLEFVLANLKYLDPGSKAELITHGRLIYSAIRSLSNVDAVTVVSFLNGLRTSILNDNSLSKQIKVRCFNSGVLSMLAKLYDYRIGEEAVPSLDVQDALQQLLLQVCTSPNGSLLAQDGWYPVGTNPEVLEQSENMIDLGLDSPLHFDDYTDKVPVKNTMLSTFLQTLRPENDVLQANLITAIFEAAPELVADYFTKKQKFIVPPGDDPKWRGQFAFLFSVVQLPVPKDCGWHDKLPLAPPPLSIVVESILPRPLDRATLGKCLRMNDDVMTISAARLLTVAFVKLEAVLNAFGKAPPKATLWRQASGKLINLFVERILPLHDIVTAFQKVDRDNEQTRTTVLESVATYLRVLPSLAASSKFDFGPSLMKIIQVFRREDTNVDEDVLVEQIQHLLRITSISPSTRWFHKGASDDVSLIVQLFQFCVQRLGSPVTKQALPVLKAVLHSKGVISTETQSFEALVSSLSSTKKWEPALVTSQFLDNCLSRTIQRPVKYLDQLEQAQQLLSDSTDLSLVACCVAEQWQYIVKKEDSKAIKNVAGWVAKFFSALDAAGENYRVMTHFKEDVMNQQCKENETAKAALDKSFEKQRTKPALLPNLQLHDPKSCDGIPKEDAAMSSRESAPDLDLANVFPPPPPIPRSLSGLNRWSKPDFESEIHTGRLASVIRCLISPEAEIRIQAFHTLQGVMYAVEESAYEEKTQLYLLLGELCETVKAHNLSKLDGTSSSPLPSIVAELAIHFLPTIAEPSSPFYRKTNNYLLRGPSWSITHILAYWISETFFVAPEIDDADIPFHVPQGSTSGSTRTGTGLGGTNNAQALEVEHLLDLLLRSLRTGEDMNLFRRAHVFTRLFSYYLAPICPRPIRKKILGLVYRATSVIGGSDTLITRTGVREWLSVAKTVRLHSGYGPLFGKIDEEVNTWVEGLEKEIKRTCHSEGIKRWEAERRSSRAAVGADNASEANGQVLATSTSKSGDGDGGDHKARRVNGVERPELEDTSGSDSDDSGSGSGTGTDTSSDDTSESESECESEATTSE